MELFHLVIIAVPHLRGDGERAQTYRTDIYTFAATDAGGFFRLKGMIVLKQQNTLAVLCYRGIEFDRRITHHRAAADDFATPGRGAVEIVSGIR